MKTSVDSQGYRTPKRFAIDYTDIYSESQLSHMDTETIQRVRGQVDEADLVHIGRVQLFEETKKKIEDRPANHVWECGYWSTDDEEDNDTDQEDDVVNDDEEYDEEEEDSEEEERKDVEVVPADPTQLIK